MGMYTQCMGKILLKPNLPGDVDEVLKWLLVHDAPLPHNLPQCFYLDWDPGSDRGVLSRVLRKTMKHEPCPRMDGLLRWAGQWDGEEPELKGRLLTFDFNLKNYEQEIQRFLHWVSQFTEKWSIGYQYEEDEFMRKVELRRDDVGFEVLNDTPFTDETTVDVMGESLV